MYLGRFLGVTLDTYQDTSGDVYLGLFIVIHHDTSRYICGIHMGYILKYIPLECIQRGTYLRCRIHAGYMRDTCICKGDQDTFGIHKDTSEIHDEIHVSQMHPERDVSDMPHASMVRP
jgi:hypothetical protein